ncbi:alpha-galactosidase [Arthrobacter sp. Hiyo8]|nr:alpha-galactosidase [Arthrobacter sp. Hiyo8]
MAGPPGLRGQRIADGVPGLDFSARLRVVEVQADGSSAVASAAIVQKDPDAGITVTSTLTLHPGGLLELRHTAVNDGTSPFQLDELATVLPVGPDAVELLDLTGRWCRERHPQRRPVQQGTWVRTGRHGRTGHDSSLLFAAGTAGFGNRHGKVWATHLAWSGNHEQFADTVADGRTMIGGSELLGPAEVVLQPGEGYTTPALFAAYSDRGLDGISEAFYSWFRSRPHHVLPAASTGLPAGKPRPVVLNTWEAVYFDHKLDTLIELAESAAELGVERFVLDDGWFRGRRDDHAGLGDWYVDETLWPDGLTPLIEAVNSHGMEFGLWVEPEMVNLDSDVARAHPDWIVGPAALSHKDGGRLPLEWRHQHIIDLVNPAAWQYVFERIDALLGENNIKYLKWDQNRDLAEHGHAGRASVHAQTLAAYRLFDELRKAHPGVEIESCSSGGARVDLGILERTDRIWGSDCNDALERQTIQRWTGVVVPPELVGGHIGPPPRTPRPARTISPSAPSLRYSGISAWNGMSATSKAPNARSSSASSACTRSTGGSSTAAGWSARTFPTTRSCCTVWCPTTARPRCSPSSAPGRRSPNNPGVSLFRASTPSALTGCKQFSPRLAMRTMPARSPRCNLRHGCHPGLRQAGASLRRWGFPCRS